MKLLIISFLTAGDWILSEIFPFTSNFILSLLHPEVQCLHWTIYKSVVAILDKNLQKQPCQTIPRITQTGVMQIQKVLSSTWNNNNIERWSDNLIIGRHISFPATKAKIHRKSDLVLFAPTVTVINAGKVKVNMTFSSPASRGAKKTNTGETSKGHQTKQQTDGRLEDFLFHTKV